MPRLRRSDCSTPGITRVRRGRGFSYVGPDGRRIDDPDVLARIADLVIPPAWRDVWICPWPHGHIQATGIDAAGRKQYLYHPQWRLQRDRAKFDDMLAFARDLPPLRDHVEEVLGASDKLTRDRVLACAVRLLDLGFFRIGSEDYAVTNETYGLATIRKDHVRLEADGTMVFDYPGKHGIRVARGIVDPLTADIVARLKRRRGGGPELLAYKAGGEWRDIRSADINLFLKESTGQPHSAKDFRTWHATVLCALNLAAAAEAPRTDTGRKRAVAWAVKQVAHYLGNTPAVCRSSYIDPRVIDAYNGGVTIRPALLEAVETDSFDNHHPVVERAVLTLIEGLEHGRGIERAAA